MNYVNKENAKALKDLGFDVPVNSFFTPAGFFGAWAFATSHNTNAPPNVGYISAPDFLTAADWLLEKYTLRLEFHILATIVDSDDHLINAFTKDDHRNAAIAYAIELIKNRNNEAQN